jgi:hypothetical protein
MFTKKKVKNFFRHILWVLTEQNRSLKCKELMRRHRGLTKEEAEAMIKAFNFESLFQISILNEPPLLFKKS